MKNLKFLFLISCILIYSSCGSVFSTVGNKETNINTKCDNCESNDRVYRGYGKSEAESGPDAEMGARDDASLVAYAYLSKQISTHVMNVASRVFEKKTDDGDQSIKAAFVEATKTQSHALLQGSKVSCKETKIVYKRKNRTEYVVATVCVELLKKNLNDELYRANKELFSQANIDYDTFSIRLSAQLKDR